MARGIRIERIRKVGDVVEVQVTHTDENGQMPVTPDKHVYRFEREDEAIQLTQEAMQTQDSIVALAVREWITRGRPNLNNQARGIEFVGDTWSFKQW